MQHDSTTVQADGPSAGDWTPASSGLTVITTAKPELTIGRPVFRVIRGGQA